MLECVRECWWSACLPKSLVAVSSAEGLSDNRRQLSLLSSALRLPAHSQFSREAGERVFIWTPCRGLFISCLPHDLAVYAVGFHVSWCPLHTLFSLSISRYFFQSALFTAAVSPTSVIELSGRRWQPTTGLLLPPQRSLELAGQAAVLNSFSDVCACQGLRPPKLWVSLHFA